MLEADVLSVAMEFLDSLMSDTNKHRNDDYSTCTIVRTGAECRCVSITWCRVVDEAIARDLPSMSSETLATLALPGKLRFVLLSCLYVSHDQGINKTLETLLYDSLVTRAETCATELRVRAGIALAPSHPEETSSPAIERGLDDGLAATSGVSPTINKLIRCMCCRVALRRIVQQALTHPGFVVQYAHGGRFAPARGLRRPVYSLEREMVCGLIVVKHKINMSCSLCGYTC